ncbi:MAG: histidine kinase [Rubrivivax sp.]
MPHPAASPVRRSMAVRAAINQLVCVLIALMLRMLGVDTDLAEALVFSLIIGNLCWLLIESGRIAAGRWVSGRRGGPPGWPGWGWMGPIVVGSAALGYLAGHALARLVLGLPSRSTFVHLPVLLFSVSVAVTISYLFYARERLHLQALQAAAAERAAGEAQLKLLQSQLEPHMLFNTLANLRVLIGLDPPRAQAMLDHLVAFLRTTLTSTRTERHALADEFAALADYLALMAVRMGPRLAMRFDLPDELRQRPVPPLLLQPLVENAIRHGLEPRVEGGRIDVGARRLGERLELTVRDTGVGLQAASAGGTRFGLEQVRTRLATLYGDAATLVLEPAADAEGGTRAVILLPIEESR